MVQYRDLLGDTICSPITPPGYSGVAVIRVSGEKAFSTTLSFMEKPPEKVESHRCVLTNLVDSKGSTLDQVLVTFFAKNRSFTGDETVEISCHGNPLLINAIIRRYLELGCRSAERGEFSFRAYYNGKLDLVQAESIHSLVTTNIKKGSETFLGHLSGQLSEIFKEIENKIISASAHLEATIDFVEQDIEASDYKLLEVLINDVNKRVNELLVTYDTGKRLHVDPKVLLLGETNVGKSSLFNKLVQVDRAIVTDIAGTTRDIVSEVRFLGHHSVQFLDSAGLRETSNPVEAIGIQRSWDEVQKADVILYVLDVTRTNNLETLQTLPADKTILIFNKIDLLDNASKASEISALVLNQIDSFPKSQISYVSTLENKGISELLKQIDGLLTPNSDQKEVEIITQARHFNHLTALSQGLFTVLNQLSEGESPDLISQELRLGLSEIHQLLGKEYDDEVLDKIFSDFCIGK